MGTIWETLAVYGLQGLLWFVALWRVGARPCVVVLGVNLFASWIIGEAFIGNDRAVAMILLDLITILTLQELRTGPHERLVAALALAMIIWRTASYAIIPYTGRHTYAAALNCAVTVQLLIAGGWIDQWGRSLDHRLDRLHPRLARAVRHVAT